MILAATPPSRRGPWTHAATAGALELCDAFRCRALADEPLARHVSMGVGGATPLMAWPRTPAQVAELLGWMQRRDLPWKPLGGGTNVLVGDDGVEHAVVALGELTEGTDWDLPLASFPAGVPTARALRATARRGLAGLEWAAGLPGTLGGAAAGNAGCWGGETADVVQALDVVTPAGETRRLERDALSWSYRSVDLERVAGEGAVIVAVTVELRDGDADELEARYRELQDLKRRRQPVGARNSGCIFRNPDPDNPAGRLIEMAGCKGLRIGDAEVSTVHGNFFVNHGGATADDVDRLVERVRTAVEREFGVDLEEEIRRW